METLKEFYNKVNNTKNKTIKNTVIFSSIAVVLLILSAIYIFWNFRKSRTLVVNDYIPKKSSRTFQRQYVQKQYVQKPIHKSPEQKRGYLIRRKPGYTEQSPRKKSYPTKFKISSILD
tara:strand:- start:426 stop:779 length:354 start_codon:yes stop_codon:yes gene_type:complete